MRPIAVLRHVPHESLGTLESAFREAGLVYSYVNLYEGVPKTFHSEQLAGLVVLGGPMNVDETHKYPFLIPETAWIRDAIYGQLPVLGICLGAQLVAKALGAPVRANPVKEIGWYSIELTDAARDDRLFAGCEPTVRVFQWHGDTFDMPQGAVRIAGSEQCRNQAFRFRTSTYGLQFHLEVTAEMINQWVTEPAGTCEIEALSYINPDDILARTPSEVPKMHALGAQVFGRFCELCQARSQSA